jgi:hypothetical protein
VTSAKHDAMLRFAEALSDRERTELARAIEPILARFEAAS